MKVLPVVLALLLLQSQQTAPTFLETLEVRITNVDVVVTDHRGNAVRGLRREDFAVLESGKRQAITNFAEYGGSKGVAEAVATPAAPAAAPDSDTPPRRKFLFYIDEMSLTDANRAQLVKSATDLVRGEMRPGDEAMVIARAKVANLPLEFTSDRAVLETRLRQTLEEQTRYRANTGPQEEEFFYRTFRPTSADEANHMARIYATRVNRRITSTLRALLGLVGSLNQTSGRKVLIVMSESISSTPGREAFGLMAIQRSLVPTMQSFAGAISAVPDSSVFDAGAASARGSWYDVRPMIKELAARASANGVTIYTLQPDFAGAVRVPGAGADTKAPRGVPSRQGQSARGDTFAVSQFHRMIVDGTRDTLGTLADDTGGKMFLGARELAGGFRQIAEDLTSYYSIGYRSEGGGEQSIRKIEVRVNNRPDLVVRARREMLRRSPEREMDEIVAANLIAPRAVNELGIAAGAGNPEHQLNDTYRIPVAVKIPLGKLTFIPDGNKYRGMFTVHYAAADGADYTTGIYREQTLEIPASEIDAARAKFFTYTATLVVSPGTLKVAVGVYDRYSHLAGFQQLEVVAK